MSSNDDNFLAEGVFNLVVIGVVIFLVFLVVKFVLHFIFSFFPIVFFYLLPFFPL